MNYYKEREKLKQDVKAYIMRAQDQKNEPLTEFVQQMLQRYPMGFLTLKRVFDAYGLELREDGDEYIATLKGE